jgi:hypothetical protein
MKMSIKKFIAMGIIVSSICVQPITGVSASWKHNNDNTWSYDNVSNGWFKDNNNWYFFKNNVMQTGWLKDNDGSWYYLSSNGEMLHDTTTPDGFKVGSNGIYIVNNTVNNTTNNANSNNTTDTNLTNNIDNSTKSSSDITLNNTGSITNNTTNNNVDVKVTQKSDDTLQKQLAKNQADYEKAKKESQDKLNAYYQVQIDSIQDKIAQAKIDLERIKNQKTIKSYEKQSDGSFQFVYTYDKTKVASQEKLIKDYETQIASYKALMG